MPYGSVFMNKLISIYINNGVSLLEQGENTVIIPIELSNDIIDILENLNFFILGGDLYKKNNNKFEHTYDNWYYEGNIQSDSIIKTREYLDNFKNNQNLYVSFVSNKTVSKRRLDRDPKTSRGKP